MTKNYERVKNAIQASSVEDLDKLVLLDYFADIEDEHLESVAVLFEKKGDWVVRFNENRKKKALAISSGNSSLWQELLEEEKGYLKSLVYDID